MLDHKFSGIPLRFPVDEININLNIHIRFFNADETKGNSMLEILKRYTHISVLEIIYQSIRFCTLVSPENNIHTYIFDTNTRNRARPSTFSKLWSA